ncbi:MAG: prolyl oligopeptidase family serine peptidase [Lewinellaceae bacterium]|nr:prolyl oligopeptidase family serine peptidase [Lewinellaceae bacterium]
MRILSILLFLSLGLTTLLSAQPATTGKDRWTIDDILFTESVGQPVVSPNNQLLVWAKRRGVKEKDRFVADLYLTRLNQLRDGKPLTTQLTHQDENDSSPFFSRDGETIYFLSSREEGKKLWSMSIFGGEPEAVAEFKTGISNPQWLSDSTLAFVSTEGTTLYEAQRKERKDNVAVIEDSVHWSVERLFVYHLKTKKTTRLTDNRYQIGDYKASRDGQWVVYSLIRSPHYGIDGKPAPTYHLLNVATGQTQQILSGMQTPGNFQFTADNQGFYFTAIRSSNPEWQGAGVGLVYYYDLASSGYQQVNLDWKWEMEGSFDVVGNDILVTLANGPTNVLAYYQHTGNTWRKSVIDLGDKNEHVNVMAVSMDGTRVVYDHSTASQLPRYYTATLTRQNNQLSWQNEVEWIELNKGLQKKPIARSEVMRWKGYQGEEVTGILYYPENYDPAKRYPLMLSIHGGPSGVDMDRWSERWSTYPQIMSQRGAFVLKPNYHGSSNHGQAFVESIKQNYYTPELTDITNAIQVLDERGMIDRQQLGAMGWSNGAILTTMLTVRYPDMFKVACAGAGDVNWTSDYGTCQFGVTFDQSYFGGAPWDNRNGKTYNEQYILLSPLFEMEQVKTPTIIFHGSEDRAVPRDQSWEYYRALQQIGQAPVRFLWFPDQPHGLQKITHQQRKMTEELAWIDQYLFGKNDQENEALKKDSPLAQLLVRDSTARYQGQFGVFQGGKLLPEVVTAHPDSLAMGRFEVTNAQFRQFDPRRAYPAGQDNYPAEVTLEQAKAYLTWLNKLTGKTYRLPAAAEAKALHKQAHSFAAKENTLNYWAGYDITPLEVPLLQEKIAKLQQTLFLPVGSFAAQKTGQASLYDLGGNLAEWAADGTTYGWSAYDFVDARQPQAPSVRKQNGFRIVLSL